jgi:hypothetical protein
MDGLDIEIEGDSEPAVALALLKVIMLAEGKAEEGGANADWVLSTYVRCLAAVTGMTVVEEEDEEEEEEEAKD